ncbi:hypothetical protein CBR_g79859, partial [Chara braunii]
VGTEPFQGPTAMGSSSDVEVVRLCCDLCQAEAVVSVSAWDGVLGGLLDRSISSPDQNLKVSLSSKVIRNPSKMQHAQSLRLHRGRDGSSWPLLPFLTSAAEGSGCGGYLVLQTSLPRYGHSAVGIR